MKIGNNFLSKNRGCFVSSRLNCRGDFLHRVSGFTLVEILLVVIIIGVLALCVLCVFVTSSWIEYFRNLMYLASSLPSFLVSSSLYRPFPEIL